MLTKCQSMHMLLLFLFSTGRLVILLDPSYHFIHRRSNKVEHFFLNSFGGCYNLLNRVKATKYKDPPAVHSREHATKVHKFVVFLFPLFGIGY